ncbi:MAG: LPS export ABC transporter periplasmic protein LptC [Candidatus Rokuibacteriota bacterium]|nr:MAG: LPS export ABC transporter periplasmic protein LptC [Candidatus Rokubacteria bacterium]
MHTLARVILAVVAVFVIVVTATLVIKSRSARVESLGPSPASADLQIKQVDLEEEAQGVRWRLKADQALMYDEAGVTKLQKVNANVYQRDRTWTIVGDEGELDRKTNNVELRRNVVVTSDDGLRLETSVLRWEAERKRLWTDAPVVLSKNGSVVRGTALNVLMADEATTVGGRVRATFVTSRAR